MEYRCRYQYLFIGSSSFVEYKATYFHSLSYNLNSRKVIEFARNLTEMERRYKRERVDVKERKRQESWKIFVKKWRSWSFQNLRDMVRKGKRRQLEI